MIIDERLSQNYDYCYLESMHWLFSSGKVKASNIICGLSYGLDAIETNYIKEPTINLAMHSQDLYYDVHHLLKILQNDKDHIVKKWIFVFGYYSLFYDLSHTQFGNRCLDIYYPLFKALRHYNATEEQKESAVARVSDPEFIEYYHEFFMNNPRYYNECVKREEKGGVIEEAGGWLNISQQERDYYGGERARLQNKHLEHVETFKENVELLYKAFNILAHSGIKIYVITMPASKEYLSKIDPRYKTETLSILNGMPHEINYVDFNDEDMFDIADFEDYDHLNTTGAIKLSKIISEIV